MHHRFGVSEIHFVLFVAGSSYTASGGSGSEDGLMQLCLFFYSQSLLS